MMISNDKVKVSQEKIKLQLPLDLTKKSKKYAAVEYEFRTHLFYS